MPDIGRCTGHCCKCFHLNYTYKELYEKVKELEDGEQIRDMVVPVYWECTGQDPNLIRYNCKNQLPNGNCEIYENRPAMCRGYPGYGRIELKCEWAECTL